MPTYDFIVDGLGTAGSSTCMTLARRGYKVLGIDNSDLPTTWAVITAPPGVCAARIWKEPHMFQW